MKETIGVSEIRETSTTCRVVGSACCQSLESTIKDVGCCINILNVGGLVDKTGTIERGCSNIDDVPGDCGGSTLSGPVAPTTTATTSEAVAPTIGTLLGALAVLVAIMLKGLF